VKARLLLFIIVMTGVAGKGQSVKRPFIIESKAHTGMILPLYKAIDYLIKDDVYAFDINVSFQTDGKDYWEKLYNYPRTGVGYSYWWLGNNEVFGKAHALYSFLSLPLNKRNTGFSFNYQISFGGAYVTKIFDIYENQINDAIGSHVNFYIRMGLDGKIRLFQRCDLIIEGGATHFSNGKVKSPNNGINAGTFSLGINYQFGNNVNSLKEPEIPVIGKRYVQSVIYSAGSKVYDNLLGKKYFTSSISYKLQRVLNHKIKTGLGADFFYDGSISEGLAGEDGIPEKDFYKLIRFGIHTSFDIRYKQLMLGLQVGTYLYSKYTVLTPVYNRISLLYQFSDHLIGSFGIKSHMGKADFLEFGIGYCW
jgi:hypothetical protein